MLRIEALRKIFVDKNNQELVAVNDLSLDISSGEIIGLLGMNGAGKSTTLRMLSTIVTPSSGAIFLNDQNIHVNSGAIRKNIGFLSGSTGLYRRLSARETLEWFGRLNGMDDEVLSARIAELAILLGMEDFLDRRCEKLSTGQKQKVNIARTIIHDPSLLILDEATTGLDVVAKQAIIRFIRHMRAQERVIVFSTHHMDEVNELCDKIAVLHRGQLLGFGTIEEVLEKNSCKSLGELFGQFAEGVVV
jgi:sodium transport system ATP-binding protein